MHLLHLHCIFLRQSYTYPALFGLMLLHIFLILLVITGCTGWYNFLSALSIVSLTVSLFFLFRIYRTIISTIPDGSDILHFYTPVPINHEYIHRQNIDKYANKTLISKQKELS